MGDSITDGSRNKENDFFMGYGYANMVAGELSADYPYVFKFYNRGINGHRIVDLYARIRSDMINLKPDYMSILVGVNDVWHEYTQQNGVSVEKYEMIYSLMIEELLQELPNLKIMILEPFVVPGSATRNTDEHPLRWEYFQKEVHLRAAAAKRIAQKFNLPFVPLQDMFTKITADAPESYWIRDGVHPTNAGHTLIKRAWIDTFQKMKWDA